MSPVIKRLLQRRKSLALAIIAMLGLGWYGAATQARGVNVAGDFDFYVLALSWSPSYCEAEGQRANRRQCNRNSRPYAFIVHGLWPQYERGYPEYCPTTPSYAPNNLVDRMLDMMPSAGLIRHEWKRHGTCSGMTPQGYFAKVRAARDRIAIPQPFVNPGQYRMVGPDDVERLFQSTNPGLPRDAIAVTCDLRRLREVRICMSKDLKFRACPEVDRRSCRNPRIAMPPVR